MNRPMIPMRRFGRPARHRRVRRRPIALVLRRPPARAAVPRPTIRAADHVSVTLAPRFTMVLQQYVTHIALLRHLESTVLLASAAPVPDGQIGRNEVPPSTRSWSAPPTWASSLDRRVAGPARLVGVPAGVRQASRGRDVTRTMPISAQPLTTTLLGGARPTDAGATARGTWSLAVSSPRGSATASRVLLHRVEAARGPAASGWPGQIVVLGQAVGGRALRGLGVSDAVRRETVTGGPSARPRPGAGRTGVGDPAMISGSLSRVDLALAGLAPSDRPRDRHIGPVTTVYREEAPRGPASAPATAPEARPPAAPPALDIDRLDRELWRRFEKRARTERERHGRA